MHKTKVFGCAALTMHVELIIINLWWSVSMRWQNGSISFRFQCCFQWRSGEATSLGGLKIWKVLHNFKDSWKRRKREMDELYILIRYGVLVPQVQFLVKQLDKKFSLLVSNNRRSSFLIQNLDLASSCVWGGRERHWSRFRTAFAFLVFW